MTVPHTPRRRDLYQAATAVLTGLAAFGSLVGTGYAAGAIAHRQDLVDKGEQQSKTPAATTAAPTPPVKAVARRRPYRTVVRTEVVHQVSSNAATVGTGGTISATATGGSGSGAGSASSSSSSSSSSGGGGGHAAPAPPAQAPAPAPKPAPAPSSGS